MSIRRSVYSDGILPAEGEEKAADACTHVCSEESGCITKELNCPHVHDETCGYSEGSPCTFDPSDCELCNPTDSGEPEGPAECTCETLCTEGVGNLNCPVCTQDIAACQGEAPAECTCETLCTADSVNPDCPVCSAEGADLTACAGTVEEGDAAEETDPAQNPAEQTVTAWEWIGADNLNEGTLPLTGAGEANPVDFDTVVTMLPTGVTATVAGSEEPAELALTWSCEGFPAQATEGEYTFTAALPEGYALSADAAGLTVSVILGGGTTMVGLRRPQGEGIESNPYNIYYKEEMFWFAALVNGTLTDGTEQNSAAWAKVWNSIDLGNEQWTPIGTKEHPYTGRFTGVDQYSTTISGLRIDNATSYSGLFGYLGNGAEVDIFTVEGTITINSSDVCYVGGVAGASKQGSAIMCVNSNVDIQIGSGLTGIAHIGGILGDIYDNGTHPIVNRCINGGNITVGDNTKADQLGGIVGLCLDR